MGLWKGQEAEKIGATSFQFPEEKRTEVVVI